MKKLLSILFVSVLFLTSCDELSELTKISLPVSETVTIPVIPIMGSQSIDTPTIKTGLDSVLTAAGTSSDFIEGVTLDKMELVMTSEEDDFSFLKSVEIYIVSSDTDEEPVKIASATDISDESTLDFETYDADLTDFILSEGFSLRIDLETKDPSLSSKEVEINLTLLLDLKILGL